METHAKPLQMVLTQNAPLKLSMSRAAELLPTPLYIAYSQLVAVGQAMQLGCSASIVGSSDEAESFARQLAQEPGDEAQPNGKPASVEELYKVRARALSAPARRHYAALRRQRPVWGPRAPWPGRRRRPWPPN